MIKVLWREGWRDDGMAGWRDGCREEGRDKRVEEGGREGMEGKE